MELSIHADVAGTLFTIHNQNISMNNIKNT
jgi:hypothetical protein